MTFDWLEYFNLASELVGKNIIANSEAKFRSSISRTYYFCFCTTRDYFCTLDPIQEVIDAKKNRSGKIHKILIDELEQNRYDRTKRKLGITLKRLRVVRNLADYEEEIIISQSKVDNVFDDASDVMEMIYKLTQKL